MCPCVRRGRGKGLGLGLVRVLDRATGPLVSCRGVSLGSPDLPAPPLAQPPTPFSLLLHFRYVVAGHDKCPVADVYVYLSSVTIA